CLSCCLCRTCITSAAAAGSEATLGPRDAAAGAGMNLRHLRAFAAVVDAGGVARAAGGLHLSQPALSRQIAALEQELGVALFDRVGRRVQLTPEGEDLLRHGRRLLA